MENLVNLGRQFLDNQNGQQGQNMGNMGNMGNMNGGMSSQQGGGGFDLNSIISHAVGHNQQQGGQGNSQMFSQAASFLQNKHQNGQLDGNVDEGRLMNSFNNVQQNGGGSSHEIGEAAAVDAVRKFFGGGGQQQGGSIESLIGHAMSLAGKQSGGNQSAMDHASETVMKLVMKHKLQSMMGGGGGGLGGASQLMSLLS